MSNIIGSTAETAECINALPLWRKHPPCPTRRSAGPPWPKFVARQLSCLQETTQVPTIKSI